MQQKMDVSKMLVKGQLMMLQERVTRFPSTEFSDKGSAVEKRNQAMEDVELKFIEMKRKNKELELEKRELTVMLVAAQARIISSVSNLIESRIMSEAEEELRTFRHANEELPKEVERLQKNEFDIVEELVYQRWLSACLRFEILKTSSLSGNLNRKSNQKLHEKPKRPLLEDSISLQAYSTDVSEKNCTSSTATTIGSSSSSLRSHTSKGSSLIHDINEWEGRNQGNGRICEAELWRAKQEISAAEMSVSDAENSADVDQQKGNEDTELESRKESECSEEQHLRTNNFDERGN